MNNTLKKSLIMLSFLFLIIGLAVGVNALVKPVIADNEMKEKISSYSEVLDGIISLNAFEEASSDEFILDQQIALDAEGNIIGYLYKARATNSWGQDSPKPGSITITIALSEGGSILGVSAEVDQSMRKDETKAYVEAYVGLITSPEVDGVAAPTTKDSLKLVDQLLASIKAAHSAIEVSHAYTEYFGAESQVLADPSFVPIGTLLSRRVVKNGDNILGYIYIGTGTSAYEAGNTEEKSVQMEFVINTAGILLGYDQVEGEYNHTGSFYRHVRTYLNNNAVGKDIKDYTLYDAAVDGSASATNTVRLVSQMLVDIKGVIDNE